MKAIDVLLGLTVVFFVGLCVFIYVNPRDGVSKQELDRFEQRYTERYEVCMSRETMPHEVCVQFASGRNF